MIKRISLILTVCFLSCFSQVEAAVCAVPNFHYYTYYPNGLATVTGNVEALGLNSIDIFDEDQKRVVRLIYFSKGDGVHPGEYVRVYYHPDTGIVQTVKAMTVLPYIKNTQNLGYIYGETIKK